MNLRLLVPLVAILIGIIFALGIAFTGTERVERLDQQPAPEDTIATDAPGVLDQPNPDATLADADDLGPVEPVEPTGPALAAEPPRDPAPATDPAAPVAPTTQAATKAPDTAAFRASPAASTPAVVLGDDTMGNPYHLRVDLNAYGAGLRRITLANYAQYVDPATSDKPRVPFHLVDVDRGLAADQAPRFFPYAARRLQLNAGPWIDLSTQRWHTDGLTTTEAGQQATYRLPIVDAAGQTVVELIRTWSLAPGSYDLELDQRIVNRSGRPVTAVFEQYGQGDVLTDLGAYLGDRRMFITGHFRPETPEKFGIYVDDSFLSRASFLGHDAIVWPNTSLKAGSRLAWLAAENRYFALITHAPVPPTATATADVPELESLFPRIGYHVFNQTVDSRIADPQRVAIELETATLNIAPGKAAALDLAVYAGPRKNAVFEEAPYSLLHFDKLIRYELGCTWCTFQWLAKGLLGYLKAIHWVVADWGVAIIILVLTVRLILHPITKRAQTNMMKMSKQMGSLQPEVQKLKDKYKDQPTELNREMMKLYREKGINPANVLGCAPMLLQTPIWIALYAMLYFAIELRHEPAFYGIFQAISNGSWHFLQDLSISDNFIRFVEPGQPAPRLNLYWIQPEFRSINILPLAMAFVFYFQMKLTTPPPQNDQQKQQQAIMKFMPFIFPVMLYSAPAGLTLYICCSTLAGIVDSWIVRKHVREQEEAGTLFDKKPIKPGGFRDKLQKRFELAQQMAAEKQAEIAKQKGGGGSGGKSGGVSGGGKPFKKRR